METLSQHQRKFARLFAEFVCWVNQQPGHEVVLEEVKRSPEQAKENAASGAGIANSLHVLKCAGDISLFIDGAFVTDIEAYRPLGERWKAMDPDCCWGGDFKTRPDADHFSLQWQGVK